MMMTLPLDLPYVTAYEEMVCRAWAFWRTMIQSARLECRATLEIQPQRGAIAPAQVTEHVAAVVSPELDAPITDTSSAALNIYLKRQYADIAQERTEVFSALRAYGFGPTGQGVAEDVRHALATLTAQVTALTTTQHEPGESTNDHSVVQHVTAKAAE